MKSSFSCREHSFRCIYFSIKWVRTRTSIVHYLVLFGGVLISAALNNIDIYREYVATLQSVVVQLSCVAGMIGCIVIRWAFIYPTS